MLKVLYIHGLDSSPNSERMNFLQELGHTVFALHIDYRNEPKTLELLSAEIEENGINYIVGSSLGGYLGFWLSEKYDLPALLFNPAMEKGEAEVKLGSKTTRTYSPKWIVIGDLDDTVEPDTSWKMLSSMSNSDTWLRMIRCQWLGHQIDIQTYRDSCFFAGLHLNSTHDSQGKV
ncbi:MAG: YqiA/YcfP family alpha/beta fold hydrolase [Bacteroidota bacterium]